jgi:hypothetical protein
MELDIFGAAVWWVVNAVERSSQSEERAEEGGSNGPDVDEAFPFRVFDCWDTNLAEDYSPVRRHSRTNLSSALKVSSLSFPAFEATTNRNEILLQRPSCKLAITQTRGTREHPGFVLVPLMSNAKASQLHGPKHATHNDDDDEPELDPLTLDLVVDLREGFDRVLLWCMLLPRAGGKK